MIYDVAKGPAENWSILVMFDAWPCRRLHEWLLARFEPFLPFLHDKNYFWKIFVCTVNYKYIHSCKKYTSGKKLRQRNFPKFLDLQTNMHHFIHYFQSSFLGFPKKSPPEPHHKTPPRHRADPHVCNLPWWHKSHVTNPVGKHCARLTGFPRWPCLTTGSAGISTYIHAALIYPASQIHSTTVTRLDNETGSMKNEPSSRNECLLSFPQKDRHKQNAELGVFITTDNRSQDKRWKNKTPYTA